MSDISQLAREIGSKLPAGQLSMVCENAPEGTNADGKSYKDLCNGCLIDTSTDNQKACVATVVAGFVQDRQSGAVPESAPKEATSMNAECAADDVSCQMMSGGY